MPSSSSLSSSSSSSSSGSCVANANWHMVPNPDADAIEAAALRVGDNGPGPAWEVRLGAASDGAKVWDANLSDGLCSNWVGVTLEVAANAGNPTASLSVQGCDPATLHDTPAPFDVIVKVQVMAAVSSKGDSVSWRNLTATFYKGSRSQVLVLPGECQPCAVYQPQTIELTPSDSDNDRVVVSGELQFLSPRTTLPGPNELAAALYVFGA